MVERSLTVSYGQLAIFDSRLPRPFNDWSPVHAAQGFSWRPGSVSFATLETSGRVQIAIERSKADGPTRACERAIVVPFLVADHGEVEVASISDAVTVHLAPGNHELTFEHGRLERGEMRARLTFRAAGSAVSPRILIADPLLAPPPELVMAAEPA